MHALSNGFLSIIVSVLIIGGPLTLFAIIKGLNAFLASPKARIVRIAGEQKLGLLVSWDGETYPLEICRVRVDFTELTRGGRATAFSYTFEDKSAKKKSFLVPLQLEADQFAMLTDNGIPAHPRTLARSSVTIEIEDTKGHTVRRKIAKSAIREALHEPTYVVDRTIVDLLPVSAPDEWSLLTRVFPWRKAAAAAAAAPAEAKAEGGHKPAAGKSSAPVEVDFTVTKVWIEPGCIVCDACENEAPDVFHVLPDTCVVRENAPLGNGASIKAAAEGCPVDVIKFTTVPKAKTA